MKHSFWKLLKSYFHDISIEKSGSPYNPYLEVLLVQGRHQLVTKDAVYSFDDKYINFYKAFKKINWKDNNIEKVLVLGLGLGSVILMLEKKFGLKLDYTAIEIDSAICQLAQKYTLSDLDSFVEVICTDAMSFLEITEEKYDFIIMDIFQSALIPPKFQSDEFLKLLGSRLNNKGLLLFNRMNITERDDRENNTFRNRFNNVYPDMHELKIKDNLIFVNNPDYID